MTNQDEITALASFCLGCPAKPCMSGCPLGNNTAEFIKLAKEQKYFEEYKLLSKTTVLPALCGKICPHEKQCEGKCVRGIKSTPVSIGEIEAYIGKLALENDWPLYDENIPKTDKKVAVVGGGPAGLTCASFLARAGVNVTIYEKHSYLGGLFMHGIPEFRLDRDLIRKTIEKITSAVSEVVYNCEVGKDIKLDDLSKNYDAVFLAIGANLSSKMNIPGEDLDGVYGGNEFLENQIPLDLKNKTAIVNGGGNVAMDTARTLGRLGAKVYVVYRRSRAEMPAEKKEIDDALAEGITFLFQNNLIKVLGENKVSGVELVKTELVKKPNETRPSPVNIEGSNYTLDADYVFMAIGSKPDAEVTSSFNLKLDKNSRIVTNENYLAGRPKIFAGGDIVSNKKIGTVAWASRAGRDASESILKYLNLKNAN